MTGLYDIFELALILGAVFFAFGLVIYLAYLQYRKMKGRRSRHRHRSRRSMRHHSRSAGQRQSDQDLTRSMQQSTNS